MQAKDQITAVIVDDMMINIETLQELLTRYCPYVEIIGTAGDLQQAYEIILLKKPQLVFLDIELGDGNGFEVIHKFSKVTFEIIFTTAHSQYAINAFRENAVDYLLKPIRISDLQQAVEKAIRKLEMVAIMSNIANPVTQQTATVNKICLPTLEGYLFVDFNNIIRCQASGSYTVFYLKDNTKITVSLRLKICEDKLPPGTFLRVHNSHIVNLHFVSQYFRGKSGYIVMSDGSQIEVSASRKEIFLEMMKGASQI